jgi:hypothetical protein
LVYRFRTADQVLGPEPPEQVQNASGEYEEMAEQSSGDKMKRIMKLKPTWAIACHLLAYVGLEVTIGERFCCGDDDVDRDWCRFETGCPLGGWIVSISSAVYKRDTELIQPISSRYPIWEKSEVVVSIPDMSPPVSGEVRRISHFQVERNV